MQGLALISGALLCLSCARTARFDAADVQRLMEAKPNTTVLRECLEIGRVGTGGRGALHQDAIEARIVAGTWTAPKAGDAVTLPNGTVRRWRKVRAGEDGQFRSGDGLGADNIVDWPGFCAQLNREREGKTPSPGKRIWELLPAEARSAVEKGASGAVLNDDEKAEVVKGLDEVLKREDFYREKDFENLDLPERMRGALRRAAEEGVSPRMVRWVNPMLFGAAYGEYVSTGRADYAHMTVESDSEKTMILHAQGNSLVYANGTIRAGDPYSHGGLWIPISLRPGKNGLLFRTGRGQLRVELIEPKSPAVLQAGERTTPDLIVGESGEVWASILVVNASTEPLRNAWIRCEAGPETNEKLAGAIEPTETALPVIPPLGIRKVAYRVTVGGLTETGDVKTSVVLYRRPAGRAEILDAATVPLRARAGDTSHSRTFISEIDGSVQYYSVQPARPLGKPERPPALFLSLHGAGVQALGQANSYGQKTWGHLVAPTNRRPYGFDWEDWGRLDAIEVLDLNQKRLGTDPQRTYLTGHSMGGHGAWHVGMTFPDRFAAIGPSAGWLSFRSYRGGGDNAPPPKPMEAMLRRPTLASDTLSSLSLNYLHQGVYILHGEKDDNVPVTEARRMAEHLKKIHRDFQYHEQPGAGHWWNAYPDPGTDCVDWAPMFDFFSHHVIPAGEEVRQVEFYTASPGISAACHWARIEAQIKDLEISSVDLKCDPGNRRFHGTTRNVERLSLDVSHLAPDKEIQAELDGDKIENIPWPTGEKRIWLARRNGAWRQIEAPSPALKGPHRYGLFRDVFRHRFVLVYGTKGSPEENAWALARARYDSETFMYRGNGSMDIAADVDFDPAQEPDRNVVLYGNADTNAAWKALLGESPVQVRRDAVRVGSREERGKDVACLFIRPRPGSDVASVGAVAGTGLAGMRLTDRLPYFISGAGYPDCFVAGSEMLSAGGVAGVRCAGFFGKDWSVEKGEFVWRDE